MLYRTAHSIFCLCLLFLLDSCRTKEEPARVQLSFQKQRTNVLLITLDTVRADALQIYNPLGAVVPNLQDLASRSIVFERGMAQAPYTLPSHTSIFTSQYAISHGVIDNLRGLLPKNTPTLAECYRNQGYQTAAFTGSLVLSRESEINRGFDYYDDYFSKADRGGGSINRIERNAEDVFHSFEYWFQHRDANKNFFAFVHFYDAHAPYDPPTKTEGGAKERYYGEISYIDSVLGKLFDQLKASNVFDNTVILVESDHGEMFDEHKETGHGYFLYEPVLRVPLILYVPSLKKSSSGRINVPDIVQLVDIAPTLLDLTNISVPQSMKGESLVPLLQGQPKKNQHAFAESYTAALEIGAGPMIAIQNLKHKYIETARPELYDLENDLEEMHNLMKDEESIAKTFKQEIATYKSNYSSSQTSKREITAEETEQFAALGYLGGDVPQEQWDFRKDAKDYINVWNQLNDMNKLIGKKQYAEALPLIQQLKIALPNKKNAILMNEAECYTGIGDLKKAEEILTSLRTPESLLPLAKIYLRTGRNQEAIDIYKPEITKDVALHKLYNFILILRKANRIDEADKYLADLRGAAENDIEVRSFLAEASYVIERWKDVERYSLDLIQQRPWEWKWYALLCDSYEKQKEYEKSLQVLKQVESKFSQRSVYWLRMGVAFRLTDQREKASDCFARVIQLNPRDPTGYLQMASEMMNKKNADEAIRYSQQGLSLKPNHELRIMGHTILYNAFRQKGNTDQARREFELVQQLRSRRPA